jgi:hypothetical protein
MLDERAMTMRQAIAAAAVARRMPLAEASKLGFFLGVRLGRP